jgi:hypothetical protein
MLVARALGVELNLKTISVKDNETRTPEFLKVSSVQSKLKVDRRHKLHDSRQRKEFTPLSARP